MGYGKHVPRNQKQNVFVVWCIMEVSRKKLLLSIVWIWRWKEGERPRPGVYIWRRHRDRFVTHLRKVR